MSCRYAMRVEKSRNHLRNLILAKHISIDALDKFHSNAIIQKIVFVDVKNGLTGVPLWKNAKSHLKDLIHVSNHVNPFLTAISPRNVYQVSEYIVQSRHMYLHGESSLVAVRMNLELSITNKKTFNQRTELQTKGRGISVILEEIFKHFCLITTFNIRLQETGVIFSPCSFRGAIFLGRILFFSLRNNETI